MKNWIWYSIEGRSGVFRFSSGWSVFADAATGEVEIEKKSWENDFENGFLRLASPDETSLFCKVLRKHQGAFEILFDLIFEQSGREYHKIKGSAALPRSEWGYFVGPPTVEE